MKWNFVTQGVNKFQTINNSKPWLYYNLFPDEFNINNIITSDKISLKLYIKET